MKNVWYDCMIIERPKSFEFSGEIVGFQSQSGKSIIRFSGNIRQARAIRPLQSTTRATLCHQLDLSTNV